ncbi:MAG: restriction endonuclease subunit S, partial [Candidatus Subteraquimicrobiales bacterium]|nr:restriction endonuclease subunit S [Candidatus Subteraquimicrobiales bacterium]
MKIHRIRFQDIPFHRDLRCGLSLINYRHVVQHPITKRFPLTNLGKVLTLQYGEALSDEERAGGGYPVVGSNGVVGFHDEYVVEGPCIVLGRKGSAGEVTFVESNCFPIDTTFYVVRKTDSFNIKFLAYLLRVLRLQRLALLKGVPGLNRFDAYDVPIPLVPEDIQTKILRRIQPIE